jgi:hypothetical protein
LRSYHCYFKQQCPEKSKIKFEEHSETREHVSEAVDQQAQEYKLLPSPHATK